MKKTEETQEELSKRAPELVARQRELEALVDDFRKQHDEIKENKELMIIKEIEKDFEL